MNSVLIFSIILTYFSLINGQYYPIEVLLDFGVDTPVLCAGGQFNATHGVVPATCISGRVLDELVVRKKVPFPTGTRTDSIIANGGSLHPRFAASNSTINNIGIMEFWGGHSLSHYYPPRSLSKIPDTPVFCLLTGWLKRTGIYEEVYTDVVHVLPPSQCGSDDPHIHCSIFPSNTHPSCKFIRGTPLNCDNSTIAGILLSSGDCESRIIDVDGVRTPVTMLRYTSMGLFHEWENSEIAVNPVEVTETIEQNSTVLCAGTKFSETAAIVPASCIAGKDVEKLGVQRRIQTLHGLKIEAVNSEWHQSFDAANPSANNIGIIQYNRINNDDLSQYFNPKKITKIPNESAICSLTGWIKGNSRDELITEKVEVLPSVQCGSENPHVFCSIFNDSNTPICGLAAGSPLMCDNSTIAGIVLSENGCESRKVEVNGVNTTVWILKYTSMSLFHEWQNSKIAINPIEITETLDSNSKVLCAGAKINETAIIVPASCIEGRNLEEVGVQRRIQTLDGLTTEAISAEWHRDFDAENPSANNIGIIQYNASTIDDLSPFFNAKNLSKIPNGPIMCLLTGWHRRNSKDELITDMVNVLPPSECGSENPHIFCSKLDNLMQPSCGFAAGSPLSCDGETIAGILLNENGCESKMIEVGGVNTSVTMLRYTSMSLYEDWQNSGSFLKSSIIVISLGVLNAIVNFFIFD